MGLKGKFFLSTGKEVPVRREFYFKKSLYFKWLQTGTPLASVCSTMKGTASIGMQERFHLGARKKKTTKSTHCFAFATTLALLNLTAGTTTVNSKASAHTVSTRAPSEEGWPRPHTSKVPLQEGTTDPLLKRLKAAGHLHNHLGGGSSEPEQINSPAREVFPMTIDEESYQVRQGRSGDRDGHKVEPAELANKKAQTTRTEQRPSIQEASLRKDSQVSPIQWKESFTESMSNGLSDKHIQARHIQDSTGTFQHGLESLSLPAMDIRPQAGSPMPPAVGQPQHVFTLVQTPTALEIPPLNILDLKEGSITIEFKDERLGRMNLSIEVHHRDVRAELIVDSIKALHRLQQSAQDLSAHLSQEGLNLEQFSLALSYGREGHTNQDNPGHTERVVEQDQQHSRPLLSRPSSVTGLLSIKA